MTEEIQKKIDALKVKNYDLIMNKTELVRQLNALDNFINQNIEEIQRLKIQEKSDKNKEEKERKG